MKMVIRIILPNQPHDHTPKATENGNGTEDKITFVYNQSKDNYVI